MFFAMLLSMSLLGAYLLVGMLVTLFLVEGEGESALIIGLLWPVAAVPYLAYRLGRRLVVAHRLRRARKAFPKAQVIGFRRKAGGK